MSRFIVWGAALTIGIGLAGACTTEEASPDVCDPGDDRACTCDSGETGSEVCNPQGSGYDVCDCSGGTGGSGGGSGGSGGSGGGSGGGPDDDAGTGGGTGGSPMDASADASDASMDPTDASVDGSDGGDGGALDSCTECLIENCENELVACDGDPCFEADDAGLSELECMFGCLDILAPDGGTAGLAELTECAGYCGAGAVPVTEATEDLFLCMFGAGDAGTDCKADCGY